MREKLVRRFWCDHCDKPGGSRHHMANHEKHCTKNPDRYCRMCERLGESITPVSESHKAIQGGGLEALREATHNCPACMLAVIRQYPWPSWQDRQMTENETDASNFQFKPECSRFWNEIEREYPGY